MVLKTITLTGTPQEMGRQHGEELREQVRGMIRTRVGLAAEAAARANPRLDEKWCLALAEESVPVLQRYSLPVFNELAGIAEAANLTLGEMIIGNGWTDFKDLLALRVQAAGREETTCECTSLVVGGNLTADGRTYLAQTWDMNVSAGQYLVLVRREPSRGPVTLSLTTAGCLSLIGLNACGLAIGNTNLAPLDARPGVFYLALIHQVLAQQAFEDAVETVTTTPRMSGHYYHVGGPDGEFMGIETTATRHELVVPPLGSYAHTNHYLQERLLESGLTTEAGPNTLGRQERMVALTAALAAGTTATDISQLLQNHEGEHPICRHSDDPAGAATLGAAVMCPQARRLWVAAGNPCQAEFEAYELEPYAAPERSGGEG